MITAYLGLGTNLGDRLGNLALALKSIGTFARVTQLSRLYETAPVGVLDQPSFLNMAAAIETDLAPLDLLRRLKDLEKELGRTDGLRWGPRLIDLDILLYGNQIVAEPTLEVPHPRLLERRFALAPLVDVAHNLPHPATGRGLEDHLADLPQDGVEILDQPIPMAAI